MYSFSRVSEEASYIETGGRVAYITIRGLLQKPTPLTEPAPRIIQEYKICTAQYFGNGYTCLSIVRERSNIGGFLLQPRPPHSDSLSTNCPSPVLFSRERVVRLWRSRASLAYHSASLVPHGVTEQPQPQLLLLPLIGRCTSQINSRGGRQTDRLTDRRRPAVNHRLRRTQTRL